MTTETEARSEVVDGQLRLRAMVLKRLQTGTEVEYVEEDHYVWAHARDEDEDSPNYGELLYDKKTREPILVPAIDQEQPTHDVPHPTAVWAEPGDIVDVTDWAGIEAYVARGQIVLLPPDVQDHPAAPDATITEPKRKPRQSAQQRKDDA